MAMALRSPLLLALFLVWFFLIPGLLAFDPDDFRSFGPLVTKERTVVSTEFGTITAVDVFDGHTKPYHLQFIALEPSSLFLPVLLHTDMVFYVQTGRGAVSWVSEDSKDGTKHLEVERGDIYRIKEGSVFYVRSHPDATREKLRIHAIFNNFNFEIPQDTIVGAYSNISDLVRGFDDRVLQMGFKVSEEVVQAIKWAENPPSIVHFDPNKTDEKPNWNALFEALIGIRNPISLINGKKKDKGKTKAFNVFKESPDVENCNGWSIAVTNRDLRALRSTDIGVFMVNLTKGSMMGPHWNPKATEIAVVLQGRGMVQVVCPSNPTGEGSGQFKCQNTRLRVKEGDVFVVPRFHPVAQMSFNNDSLVFMGFSTTVKSNHPQYLAGKRSVLQIINRNILAMSFGTSNTTIEKFLASQDDSIMLDCTSCAEEAEEEMQKEIEREKQEEARKRQEEEEARKRQEEEEARKREEEEARKKEEEARKREEEEAKKREQEEARKRAEEEAKKREEEEEEARRRKQEEEEEARRRKQEEEASRRQEEEAAKRREQEERRKEEEAAAKRQEEEEAARRREQEKEAARGQEETARRREEEEAARRQEKEEEAARRREEEEAARRQEKEEEAARREEEETRRKEEARRRQEEEARKEEEETRRQEEEIRRQEEEEIRRREEEAAASAREEQAPGKEGGEERLVEQEARKQEKAERGTDERLEQETTKGEERIVSRKMWSI